MVYLDSQLVRGLLSNLLTRFLTTTWSIWTVSLCVVYSRMYSPNFWHRHGRFGLSVCAWFTLECTHSISDTDMVDLDSQRVRGLLSNLLTRFLTTTWSIWTLSLCVVYSQIYSLDFWHRHGRFGLSGCAWFTLESTHSIPDNDMVDLDFDLDSQSVRSLLSNLLTQFLTPTWSIWTLSVCVVYSRIYSPKLTRTWSIWILSRCVVSLKITRAISDPPLRLISRRMYVISSRI